WTPFPGAEIEVKNFQQGTPMTAPVEVKVFGEDLTILRELASEVVDSLEAINGTVYINNPIKNLKSDIRMRIDKDRAQSLAIPTASIASTVRMAVTGSMVGTFTRADRDEDYEVQVSIPRPSYPDL